MYCLKCGEFIDEDAKFCIKCGTPVRKTAEPEKVYQPEVNLEPPSHRQIEEKERPYEPDIQMPYEPEKPQPNHDNKDDKIVCSMCGQRIEDDNAFCPFCGTKIEKNPQPSAPKYKYCQGCGKQLEIGVRFCPHCGTDTGKSIGSLGFPKPEIPQNSFLRKIKPGRTLSRHKDVNDLKQRVNSWAFLIFLVALGLYAISVFFESVSGTNFLQDFFRTLESFGVNMDVMELMPDFFSDLFRVNTGASILIGLIKIVPIGLTLGCLCHFYVSCLDEKNDSINLKGIKIIYTLNKILYILEITAAVMVEGIIGYLLIENDGFGFFEDILIPALIIAPFFFVFKIFYYRSIMKAINLVDDTVKYNSYAPNCRISIYLIICVIVSCLGQIVNVFSNNNVFGSLMFALALGIMVYILCKFNSDRSPKVYAYSQSEQTINPYQN